MLKKIAAIIMLSVGMTSCASWFTSSKENSNVPQNAETGSQVQASQTPVTPVESVTNNTISNSAQPIEYNNTNPATANDNNTVGDNGTAPQQVDNSDGSNAPSPSDTNTVGDNGASPQPVDNSDVSNAPAPQNNVSNTNNSN